MVDPLSTSKPLKLAHKNIIISLLQKSVKLSVLLELANTGICQTSVKKRSVKPIKAENVQRLEN